MNLIKGLLGFGSSPAEKLIESTKAKGGFYRVIGGSRQIEIQSGNIEFQKVKDHPEYKFVVHITSSDKNKPVQHAIPIHKDMELKLFYINKNKQPKLCYQWILVNDKTKPTQYVGIIVDRNYQTELSDTFGHTIKETIDKDSKENHLSFIEKVSSMPVHGKHESAISSTSSKISSTSNLSSALKAERLAELNDVLIKQANLQETQLAFTGRLNHMVNQKLNEINPSVVFCIKQKQPFLYSIYVYTSQGYKLQEKIINAQMSYYVDIKQSHISWLDISQGSKIVQVVFDKYDVARDVQFCIKRCMYETRFRMKYQDLIKPEDEEYIKNGMDDQVDSFVNNKIVQTYKEAQNVKFAPAESRNIIKNSKDVSEKYKDKKTMVQGKTAGCTIVSLANMLDVLTIDEDKNLKKVDSIQLKDKSGHKIIPEKMLIHDGDAKLLIQNQNRNLCYYDLNEQKIIEEYNITNNDQVINDIVAEKKLAELDKFNTFIGVSNNGIYRIDPRIPKTGLAEKHIYKGDKYQFDKIVTTSDGNYAIGSLDGTIRLYNNKINTKTKACNKFSGFDKVLHLDTTKDGKWILATFEQELILLPTFSDQCESLYEHTIPVRQRQRPKRLKVKMEHLEMCKSQNKHMIPARFDENLKDSEEYIISGFGDYVVIWSFGRVLRGNYDYTFCKAEDLVNNVEFKFNDPENFFANTHSSISMQKTIKK